MLQTSVVITENSCSLDLVEYLREVVRERDALKKSLQIAESTNQNSSEFLANMSHELRTPLHAIGSFAHLSLKTLNALIAALDRVDDVEVLTFLSETLCIDRGKLKTEFHLWLTRIEANQKRQLGMIDDLLDLAKIEAGQMNFNFQQGDLLKIAEEELRGLEMLIRNKNLVVRIVRPEFSTEIYCDKEKIGRVVINLMSNAIKFTPIGKAIYIYFRLDSLEGIEAIVFMVRDEGFGIPVDEFSLVFDRFAQSSRGSGIGGTGLGLVICREIVTAHYGTIVASNHPGGGAIFTVTLPINNPLIKNEE